MQPHLPKPATLPRTWAVNYRAGLFVRVPKRIGSVHRPVNRQTTRVRAVAFVSQRIRVKSTKSENPRRLTVPEGALDFCQPGGNYYSPDRVGARVAELMRNAGLLGVSLHSLRHSHASILPSKGVPAAVVAERLGHADQNITLSIYSHALPADSRAAAKIWNDSMADVVAGARTSTGISAGTSSMLANVSARVTEKTAKCRKEKEEVGGDDGARTRDLRRDRPAF